MAYKKRKINGTPVKACVQVHEQELILVFACDMIMSMDIKDIKKKIAPIIHAYDIDRIAVFGSAARGEMRPTSDIDFLVEIKKKISLLDFVDLKLKLQEILDRKVDLVEYDALKPALRDKVLREQVVLYEKGY